VVLPSILVPATIILHSQSLTIAEVHIRLSDIVASQFNLKKQGGGAYQRDICLVGTPRESSYSRLVFLILSIMLFFLIESCEYL
jgi:hypothetical protein